MFMGWPFDPFSLAVKRSRLGNIGRVIPTGHHDWEIRSVGSRDLLVFDALRPIRWGRRFESSTSSVLGRFLLTGRWSTSTIFCDNPASREISVEVSAERKEWIGLKRCSKMAMMRNIDISIAVATKPREIALMEAPRLFHGASVSNPTWDGVESEVEYTLQGFDLSGMNSFIFARTGPSFPLSHDGFAVCFFQLIQLKSFLQEGLFADIYSPKTDFRDNAKRITPNPRHFWGSLSLSKTIRFDELDLIDRRQILFE